MKGEGRSGQIVSEVTMVEEMEHDPQEEEIPKRWTYLDDLLTVQARKLLKTRAHRHFVSLW